jgi:hypothetical protein
MKFGHDRDGKLVQVEHLELVEALFDLDAKLDGLPQASRSAGVTRIRECFEASEEALTAEDENVFALYMEGVLDFRNVKDHFGLRLQRAVLQRFGGSNNEA